MAPDDPPPPGGTASPRSLGAGYFDDLYGRTPDGDPWHFASSPYEAAKYAATLAELPRARYRSALEVGCSIGVFTGQLAGRVDRLLAVDLVAGALARASERCAGLPHCQFARVDLAERVPAGPFDLITLAEVAYYWTPALFARIFAALVAELADSGQIILVHWRAPVPDYPQDGDEVHRSAHALAAGLGLVPRREVVTDRYRLDLWERPAEG